MARGAPVQTPDGWKLLLNEKGWTPFAPFLPAGPSQGTFEPNDERRRRMRDKRVDSPKRDEPISKPKMVRSKQLDLKPSKDESEQDVLKKGRKKT